MNYRKGLFSNTRLSKEDLQNKCRIEIIDSPSTDVYAELCKLLIQNPSGFVHMYGIIHEDTNDLYGMLLVDKKENDKQDEYCINVMIIDSRLEDNRFLAAMFQEFINHFFLTYNNGKEKYVKCNVSELDAIRCQPSIDVITKAAQQLADSIVK